VCGRGQDGEEAELSTTEGHKGEGAVGLDPTVGPLA
jgi:hypothetical protein